MRQPFVSPSRSAGDSSTLLGEQGRGRAREGAPLRCRTCVVVQSSFTLIVDTAAIATSVAWAAGCDPSLSDGQIKTKHCSQWNAVRVVAPPGCATGACGALLGLKGKLGGYLTS